MKLTFLGATHEVTGSCYYLEACDKRILIDCGMEQGKDWLVNQPIPVNASEIDMILVTHAHIDHTGKLPLLTKQGFQGQIFSTEGTKLLCDIMLRDSAHIQEFEAEWKTRKAERAGKPPVEPMYTVQDAEDTMKCFVGMEYDEEKIIAEGITICFRDAGHLLGSSSIEIMIRENGIEKKVVFSGDIGNNHQPLIDDSDPPATADYVIMESTYGDRLHDKPADYATELAKILQETFDRGGNVVIPSFAVGRTQEMLYFIRQIKEEKLVKGHDGFAVYVDSPLAVEATTVFNKRMFRDFNEEAKDLLQRGINPIGFEGLKVSVTSEDSKQINFNQDTKVILSASGMCEAGRIRHHLKHNLWRPECTVLFVGYQAEGTLGCTLLEGVDKVKIFGEEVSVKATIRNLPGMSSHADSAGLISWIQSIKSEHPAPGQEVRESQPDRVFITHGDPKVAEIFKDRLLNELKFNAYAPYSGTCIDLATNTFVYEAQPEPLTDIEAAFAAKEAGAASVTEETAGESRKEGEKVTRRVKASPGFESLRSAGQRLMSVIENYWNASGKELKKFTQEVERLADHWEK